MTAVEIEAEIAFGENLKKYRLLNNYSRQELAEKIGVAAVTIAGYETGIRFPELKKLVLISDVLGVSVDELLGRGNFIEREIKKKSLKIVLTASKN